jgi:transposase-like protein
MIDNCPSCGADGTEFTPAEEKIDEYQCHRCRQGFRIQEIAYEPIDD